VIDSEGLDSHTMPADSAGNGGIKWRGCSWVVSGGDGYGASIRTTNITLPMVRANKDFTVSQELTIDGRPALTYQQTGQVDTHGNCLLDVTMTGGSLELLIDNAGTRPKTGNLAACDIAKNLAQKLVSTFPPGA
jgi:hypothetical protein